MDLAHGRIVVDLDDRATKDLARIEAEYRAAMAAIDAMDATIDIDVNNKDLKKGLRDAQRDLDEFNRTQKRLREDDKKAYAAQAKAAKEQRRALEDQVESLKRVSDQGTDITNKYKAQNAELKKAEAGVAAIRKAEEQRARALEQFERREAQRQREKLRAVNQEARVRESLNRQRTRELTTAERHARAIEAERNAVPKLQRAYAQLEQRIEKLNTARRRTTDPKARGFIDLQSGEAIREMEVLRARLAAIGANPVDIHVRLGSESGRIIRNAFQRDRSLRDAGLAAGIMISRDMSRGMIQGLKDAPRGLLTTISASFSRLGHGLTNLQDMTVRLGPFTASVRQAALAMTVFAPTILDIVGALGSLVSVGGAAAIGMGVLATGLGGAMIPALIGTVGVLKPLIGEFKSVMTASKAYNKAVMDYGQNSDQAAKKLKVLKSNLGQVDQSTVKAFMNAGKLSGAWEKATAPARAAAFNVIGQGIQMASDNMGWMAKQTNQLFFGLERGATRFMSQIGSARSIGALRGMFSNLNQSVEPFIGALANLTEYLLQVGRIGARSLPGLARQFENWSQRVLNSSNDTEAFTNRIQRMVQATKDVGRFLMSGGRFLKTFFAGGVEPGTRMLNDMTNALDRWTISLNQSGSAGQFFDRSVDGAQRLYAALAPLVSMFVNWASNMQPVVSILYQIVAPLARVTHFLAELVTQNSGLMTLASTLGVLFAVNRIGTAIAAMGGFVSGLRGLAAANTQVAATANAAAAAQARVGVAGAAGGAAGVRGAAAIGGAAGVAKAGVAAEQAASRFSRFKAAASGAILGLTGLNPLAAAVTVSIGALAYGIYKVSQRTTDWEQATQNARDLAASYNSQLADLPGTMNNLASASINAGQAEVQVEGAQRRVNQLRKQGKTNTLDYRQAVLDLRQATMLNNQSQSAQNSLILEANQRRRNIVQTAEAQFREEQRASAQVREHSGFIRNFIEESNKRGVSLRENLAIMQKEHPAFKGLINSARDYIAQVERENAAHRQMRSAQEAATVGWLNQQRALKGIVPLGQAAARSLANVARQGSRGLSAKIAVKFDDSGDARRVASQASRTLKSGVPTRIVTKIVADSRDAEQAVARLKTARMPVKKLQIVQAGGERAVAVLQNIAGHKLATKTQKIVEQGGTGAMRVLARLVGVKLPTKTQKTQESGSGQVLAALGKVLGFRIPNKTFSVTANTGQAIGAVNAVAAALGAVNSKSVTLTMTTIRRTVGANFSGTVPGHAAGRSPGMAETALVGEGNAPEMIADNQTGEVTVVREPTIVSLAPQESVIPTETAYRGRGRQLMADFAKAAGIPGFAKGRNRKDGGPRIRRGKDPDKLKEILHYRKLQDDEDKFENSSQIAERKVEEPESFVKVIGKDENGEDIFAVDEAAVKTYTAQLKNLQAEQGKLVQTLKGLAAAYQPAMTALSRYDKRRDRNIKVLREDAHLQKKIARQKDKDGEPTKAAKAAQRRIDKDQRLIESERSRKEDAGSVREDLTQDNKSVVRDRLPNRQLDKQNTDDLIATVGERAATELRESIPEPQPQPTATEGQIAALEAQRSANEAGFSGFQLPDTLNALVGAYERRMGEGQAMLRDATTANDIEAYGIIGDAANAIRGIRDQLADLNNPAQNNNPDNVGGTADTGGGDAAVDTSSPASTGATLATQMFSSSQARAEFARSFGSNFGRSNTALPFRAPSVAQPQLGMPSGGGTNITVNNTFATVPPDPMTFSRNIAFEIQAAV